MNNVILINVPFGRPVHGRTVQNRVKLDYGHVWFHVFIIQEKLRESSVKIRQDQFYLSDAIQIYLALNGLIPNGPTVPFHAGTLVFKLEHPIAHFLKKKNVLIYPKNRSKGPAQIKIQNVNSLQMQNG